MAQSGLSKRRLKEIRSLTQKKYRERLGEMLVEGLRSVESAAAARAPIKEVIVTADVLERLPEAVRGAGFDVHVVSEAEMEAISAVETSQGIVAVASIERLDKSVLRSMQRIVALDEVQDPGNAGTLIRSAAWFGVEAVVTASGTVDLYNPKVVRAAMGGLWDIAHVQVDDLTTTLSKLQEEEGMLLYAADLDGIELESWAPQHPSVMVFGSEAHGVSDGMRALIEERIVIPGRSESRGVESLNVAVAAGIVLYEWSKVRKS